MLSTEHTGKRVKLTRELGSEKRVKYMLKKHIRRWAFKELQDPDFLTWFIGCYTGIFLPYFAKNLSCHSSSLHYLITWEWTFSSSLIPQLLFHHLFLQGQKNLPWFSFLRLQTSFTPCWLSKISVDNVSASQWIT